MLRTASLIVPLTLLSPTLALAADDPVAILKQADDPTNGYQDQRFVMTMTVEGTGAATKVAKMETLQKGADKRLVRFLAPGDVKGTAILLEGGAMYMYMPQFQKVRRIASHAKNQGFMDSDFTNDDMGAVNFGAAFTPSLLDTTATHYKLKLQPKPGSESAVEHLEMLIDKQHSVITQIDYIVGGKAVRRQTRAGLKTFPGSKVMPTIITMQDLTKPHKTTLVINDLKVNSGLPDSLFTKQSLERAQ